MKKEFFSPEEAPNKRIMESMEEHVKHEPALGLETITYGQLFEGMRSDFDPDMNILEFKKMWEKMQKEQWPSKKKAA